MKHERMKVKVSLIVLQSEWNMSQEVFLHDLCRNMEENIALATQLWMGWKDHSILMVYRNVDNLICIKNKSNYPYKCIVST